MEEKKKDVNKTESKNMGEERVMQPLNEKPKAPVVPKNEPEKKDEQAPKEEKENKKDADAKESNKTQKTDGKNKKTASKSMVEKPVAELNDNPDAQEEQEEDINNFAPDLHYGPEDSSTAPVDGGEYEDLYDKDDKMNLWSYKKEKKTKTPVIDFIADVCDSTALKTKKTKKRALASLIWMGAKMTVGCAMLGPIVGTWLVAHYTNHDKATKYEKKAAGFVNWAIMGHNVPGGK